MKFLQRLLNPKESSPLFTEGQNLSEVTAKLYRKLWKQGAEVASRADGFSPGTLELSPHTLILRSTDANTILAGRSNNPFATMAETLWVWAGRNDIERLLTWLPRAADSSDDGKVWRAGYGPRLARWPHTLGQDFAPIDQLQVVIDRLKRQQASRQAIMVIYDPARDSIEKSKDYPCNIMQQFLIRDGKLNMHTFVRSNDSVFGVCINLYEWAFVWQYVASQLGVPCGSLFHTANSMHVYEAHYDKIRAVQDKYIPLPRLTPSRFHIMDMYRDKAILSMPMPVKDFRESCDMVFSGAGVDAFIDEEIPNLIRDLGVALYAKNALDQGDAETYINLLWHISEPYTKLSLLDVGQRRLKRSLYNHKELLRLFPAEDFPGVSKYLLALHTANQKSQ